MTKEEYIHKYFLNELTPKELKDFNELLEDDKEFEEEFEFQKKVKRVIKSQKRDDLRTKAVKLERKIIAQKNATKKNDGDNEKGRLRNVNTSNKRKKKNTLWKFGIAASIAVLISSGIYLFNTKPNADELFSDYYDLYPNTVYPITMNDQNVNSVELMAFQAYEIGEYTKAISYFIQLKEDQKSTYADFYLGHSYLNTNQTEKAIGSFERVKDPAKQFYIESRWYLALALIKNDNIPKAMEQLRKVINSGSYKKDKAEALLKKIN